MTSARFDISSTEADFELRKPREGGGEHGPLLCTVDEPFDHFLKHPLRILAACRLSSQLGVCIEPATLQAMTSIKMKLTRLDGSAIVGELNGMLLGDHVRDALMQTVDVLVAIMPEIAACRGFGQPTPYHIYDVWEHTAWVVQRSPATTLSRWAALLHDIGKPAAGFMDGHVIHFYGHARLSVVLARSILERLGMDPVFVSHVLSLVKMHDDKISAEPESIACAIERLDGDPELFRALCNLKLADALAHSELAKPRIQLARDLERILDKMISSGQIATD